MDGQDRANQSYLSKLSPWNRSPLVPPVQGAQGEPEPLQQQKRQDHVVSSRHIRRQYPKDCPRLRPGWFHATDVPKRRPSPATGEAKEETPAAQPKKYIAFSVKDSKAIEAAFQSLIEADDVGGKTSPVQSEGDITLQSAGSAQRSGSKPNTSLEDDDKTVKVPVNEDYLFDVDVRRRELAPAYWLGPVYDVRRATWFFQEGSFQRPCDENLATQLEKGWLKTKAWRIPLVQTEQAAQKPRSASQPRARPSSWAPSATLRPPASTRPTPQASSDNLRSRAAQQAAGQVQSDVILEIGQFEQPPNTHRLFGAHMNSVVTYQDGTTAWLLTDDFLSRMNYSVYQRFAGGGHFAGSKMTRGYINPSQQAKKLAERDETAVESSESSNTSKKGRPPGDNGATDEVKAEEHHSQRPSVSETRRRDLARQMSSLMDDPSSTDPERQDEELRQRDEREIEDDYNEADGEEQGREIEHLILVTHGIGQRLGLRLEAVNFVSDVTVLRKTLKAVYADSPDLRALNAELENTEHTNSRVQVLPICWRHLLDFPKQSLRHNRKTSKKEHDIADTESEDEEEFPSLEDITVEGASAVRRLFTDLALDILLYQSSLYNATISRIVLEECNRIYRLFMQRNPSFNGKVSLIGHSLGSAILFDILCEQDQELHSSTAHKRGAHHRQLDFEVEEFYALGSPIGLFQMLKGRTIVAREPVDRNRASTDDPMLDGPPLSSRKSTATNRTSTSSLKCQIHNIFHPLDPVSYRLEPLISPAMAALKPQPLPYTKRGIFGAPVGQGLTGISTRVSQSVSSMWSNVASSLLTRGLGYSGSEPGQVGTNEQSVTKSSGPLSLGAGVIPTAPLPAKGTEIAAMPADGQTGFGRDASAANNTGQHPPTLIDANLETLSTDFRKRRQSVESDAQTRDLGAGGVGSEEWREAEERAKKLRREEEKVRKLNSNGRVDYAIQEGAFDINIIAAIASHLSYWSDEDVSHYIISQLLSRHRIVRPTAESDPKAKQV